MDADLKQYLDDMKADLKAHADGQIEASEQRLQGQIEASEQRLKAHTEGQLDAVEQRLRAHTGEECEKVETKRLTEFHKWGRTSDMQTRQALQDAATLGERTLAAEDRISALERNRAA